MSTDLKPDWKHSHGFQPEIQDYLKAVATKRGILPHIQFNTRVISAEWDGTAQLYNITVQNNKEETIQAEILVSAIGLLDLPNHPDIQGIESFPGPKFHAGEWDYTCDLHGKRVGVVGNAASATQFVPIISEDLSVEVVNFCRTPNWFIPSPRFEFSQRTIWTLKSFPLLARLLRFSRFLRAEMSYWSIFSSRFLHPRIRKNLIKYITHTSPPEYHDKLIPEYTLGCKRILLDSNYLAALHRPNVRLNWDGIEAINRTGIITKTGDSIPLDILIFATGYVTDDYPLHIKGQNQTIKEYYDAAGGPKAYLGTTIPGFPNLFLMGGPNTATGNTSVIFFEEVQVAYTLQLIKPILDGTISSVQVNEDATDAYNDKIHARLAKSVYVDCVSWYRKGRDGKVSSIFPGAATLFWWWLRRPNLSHFRGAPQDKWQRYRRQQTRKRALRTLLTSLAVVLLCLRFSAALKYLSTLFRFVISR